MKQVGKRFLALIISLVMVVSTMAQAGVVYAEDAEQSSAYEIYPTPHSVEYKEGSFVIRSNVNVVFEDGIDQFTKDKLVDVLADKGITVSTSEAVSDATTNILVGVKESEGYVDTYAQANVSFDAATFGEKHFDAYVMDVNNGVITILGDSTDAAFYGIVSLMHILKQLDGKTISNLTIEDYADTPIRGFIEGYYGIPWSNEDRMSLMKFGGQFKMTSYIFAPKDDQYHTSKWRELYPTEEINAIAEMVKVGNENKCRFVWTAHPFMGGFNANNVAGEIKFLLGKFEQLYSVGVRQFGVLGDDVGSLNKSAVIQVMTAVSEWAKEKGDVYDTVFCPAGYNHSWQGDYSELNTYDAGFPEDVQIFWTGEAVCQPIEQKTLDHFKNHNAANGSRRSPLFWLNWPVNDINMSRLMMGKGSLLYTDINIDDLAGVVTNPMQDAEASKVALFAIADYAWNVANFDDDQSWEDCFAYIDAEASEELYTLAKHMSDPSPNGHGLNLAESEELFPMLNTYLDKFEQGTLTDEDHKTLITEFEVIAEACDAFHQKSQNAKLKEELLPFTDSLKDQALAAIAFINTQKAIDEGNASETWSYYSQASSLLASSKKHMRPTLSGVKEALPGSKHVTPFVESLNTQLSPTVNSMIDDSKQIVTFITNRQDTPSDALAKLTDNKESTEVIWKSPNSTTAGTYLGLTYSRSIKLKDVTFKMGQSSNAGDTFDAAKLQYTEDGKTWIDIPGTEFTTRVNNVTAEGLNLTVKGVRIISTADKGNMWLGCKDIVVNRDEQVADDDKPESTLKLTPFDSGKGVYDGKLANVVDGNDGTSIWYNAVAAAGDYIGVDLGATVKLGEISFVMDTGDCWTNYALQHSLDGKNYTTYDTYTTSTLEVDLSAEEIEARYVRFYNQAATSKWTKICEISVGEQVLRTDAIYTNMSNLPVMTVKMGLDKAVLEGASTITVAPGEYLGLQLDRIKDLTAIEVNGADGLVLQTSKNGVIWTTVTDTYEDARYVRLVNETDAAVTVDFGKLTIESFELEPISVEATNYGDESTHLKAFDKDRTTEAVLQGSQYVGKYITYDLGQTIELDSLKLVLHDGTTDYPRHAKVSVSEDGETWKEVMLIGNQDADNEGEADNADEISQVFPVHEISYYTLEETDINENARYIKFEITRNKAGADKWVRIREIEINGGNMYMASENDPTIITTGTESEGNTKTNMIDGDVSTTFKSAKEEAGSFEYFISEKTEIKKITILQNPATLSGAKVSVTVLNAKTRSTENVETVEIGCLMSSMNEFDTSAFDAVLSVEVEWEKGNVPEIYEIITSTATSDKADKTKLQTYYDSVKNTDTTTWTDASKAAFTDAIAYAEYALENEYAAASCVNSALAQLRSAVEDKIVKPDLKVFDAAVAEVTKSVLAEENYLARTWGPYVEALAAVEAAKENPEVSQEELDAVLADLEAAVDGLVYEVASIEELEVLAADAKALYKAEDYSAESFAVLTKAIADADAIVATDKTERQNPEVVKASLKTLEDAIAGLQPADGKPVVTNPFSDVKESDYYYAPVLWAVEKGITTGTSATTFSPEDTCTRGAVVTFIWRAAGCPEPVAKETAFVDVAESDYYYKAVLWAVEQGITTGTSATTFAPNDGCTRGQVVTFLFRAAKEEVPADAENAFTDVVAGAYYEDAVLWAVANGITTGTSATTFEPDAECTRGQIVTFIYRDAQ